MDVACHQIMSNFSIKEIVHSTGGKWESCYIDDQYIELLQQIFSKKWMDEFFIPSDFGYGRTSKGKATGFKSKIEDFIEARKPGISEINFNESLAKYARTILTKPGSKDMGSVSAYEKTTQANKQ